MPRIKDLRAVPLALPLRRPIVSSVRRTSEIVLVLVRVTTDDDVEGAAFVQGFTGAQARAMCVLIDDFLELLNGRESTAVRARWADMHQHSRMTGPAGLSVMAMSAVDLALWDALGQRYGAPVHRLLGSHSTSLPAYASDGCWLLDEPSAVAGEAADAAARGFSGVKVRVGRSRLGADLEVLAEVRATVGADVDIIVDANQGWSLDTARAAAPTLCDIGARWLEEPLPADDLRGLAQLTRELPIPVTAGENLYLPQGMRDLLLAGAVDVVMPDLQRVGGVTGWMRAAGLAESWRIPLAMHLFPEFGVHLLACSPDPTPLEWVDWHRPIFARAPEPDASGVVAVPEEPGFSIEYDWEAVNRYSL